VSRRIDGLLGRDSAFGMLEEAVGRPVLVVVRAACGTGKTALVDRMRRSLAERGVQAVHIDFAAEVPCWDQFGVQAVLAAFRESFNEFGDLRMASSLAAVSQLCRPETYHSAQTRSTLFVELVRLFGSVRQSGPSVVLFDGLHTATDSVVAARHAGCTVVATCREDGFTEPTALTAHADQVIDLEPLSDDQVDELIAAHVRRPLDPAVPSAVRTALGSLRGNPGAVLSVIETLHGQGRLVSVQGVLCLADPARPIALSPDHELVRSVALVPDIGPLLVAAVATAERFRVDDLAAFADAIGRDHATCGRVIDLLVSAGALTCDPRGTLAVPCPALGAAVLAAVGERQVRELHCELVRHLLRPDHPLPPEPAMVADHIALAGASLPPDPTLVPLLCDQADKALLARPAVAARRYRAALIHCGPHDHALAVELTGSLIHLLVRIGRYDWLGEVVAEAVAAGACNCGRYELAVAATLAALHTGVPVSPAVRDTLATDPAGLRPLLFCDRWFEGQHVLRLDELTAAFAPFRRGVAASPHPAVDDVAITAGQHDPVALFRLVLGDEYGLPDAGPLALFHRVLTGYRRGDWADALSAAQALELSGSSRTPIHHMSRLLAAEIRGCEGDHKVAAQWFTMAGGSSPFPAMWSWAESGLLSRSGRLQEAIEAGWRGYERAAAAVEGGNVVAVHWFLGRLAALERKTDNEERLLELHGLTRRLYERHGGRRLQIAALMVGALAERDFAAGRAAVDMLRKHDNQSELLRACLITSMVADEPRPWLHEAYDIARRLGGDLLRMVIKARMRECGVVPPRLRAVSQELSDIELRIIALIRRGSTNRQIAVAVRISEKTVEDYMTRLFAKTGCRTRLDLATASIEGRLAVSGYDRSGTA
jgi:DNA-binding CsgD family transcriptional regulator